MTDTEANGDLSPLPTGHRQGLAGIAVLAGLSFVSCTAVLLYLTVKLGRWHLKTWNQSRKGPDEPPSSPVDLSLGLPERHYMGEDPRLRCPPARKKAQPNQFLILIYNLLLADMHQAAAFLLNAVWVGRDGIQVRTPTCWVQGWLVQTGDLASSLFITAIAVHTYLAVVRKYTPPQSAIYITVVFLWALNYLMMILGIVITENGKEEGGFFARAAAWCWINIRYETLRLYLHYLWIFLALAVTTILYTLIFLSLQNKKHPKEEPTQLQQHLTTTTTTTTDSSARPSFSSITLTPTTPTNLLPLPPPNHNHHHHEPPPSAAAAAATNTHHHKAFLLYPLIYILCTAPLAVGRIATMAGADVPIAYFCTAGALITSNGWLDVLLWGVTRRRLLFGADIDAEASGLDTFAFMRTPHGRRWGNMVWVEGGSTYGDRGGGGGGGCGEDDGRVEWGNGGGGGGGGGGARGDDGMSIHMDTVTTVTVVVEPAAVGEKRAWEGGRSRHVASGSDGSRVTVYDPDSAPDDGLGKGLG
ncbi:G protein-coupled glucose receptor regulating Gpa2-domain-containing protein [Chaetomidium leptoderma]|uniref:G protein-coupled glucose receptor regulating Gpa2-domain-containing protein n=1 Tax=Chaetomidium leptoderma TaxID=669021 RepID=A0AAN6VRH5_9PEZI|nr:G protein-coupled glucose receptor regulating Gpa2-domain-containing protein [Chaetomidium leptoderma]